MKKFKIKKENCSQKGKIWSTCSETLLCSNFCDWPPGLQVTILYKYKMYSFEITHYSESCGQQAMTLSLKDLGLTG